MCIVFDFTIKVRLAAVSLTWVCEKLVYFLFGVVTIDFVVIAFSD